MKGLNNAKNMLLLKLYFWGNIHGILDKTLQTLTGKSEAAAHIHATRTQNIMHPAVALH